MSKVIYYNAVLINIILIYRNSWLPGSRLIMGPIEIAIIDFLFFFSLILYFNLNKVMNTGIKIRNFDYLLLISIGILTLYSTIVYNIQELTNLYFLLRFVGYFAVLSQFFFFLPSFFSNYPNYFIKYLKFISYFGFYSALIGIIMYYLNIFPYSKFSYMLISILTHPNNASVIFTLSIITTVYLYYYEKPKVSRIKEYFYIFSIFLQIFSQLLTLTRAGMIGTFLGLAIFGIVVLKKKALFIYPIFSILIPFFVWGFVESKGFSSFVSRFYLLVPAYHMLIDSTKSMLWGYGFTNSLAVYQKYRIEYNVLEENIEDPHNAVVMLMLMVGVVIALLIIFFVGRLLIKSTIEIFREKDKDRQLMLGYMVSFLISIILHCLFDSSLVRLEYIAMGYQAHLF